MSNASTQHPPLPKTTHPPFVQEYKPSPIWKHLMSSNAKWVDITAKKIMAGETKNVKLVYWYLRHVDVKNEGFSYPAQATIARAKKIDRRTVIRSLARLEELGLILRWKKARHSFYIFTLPEGAEKPKRELEKAKKECSQLVEKLSENVAQIPFTKEKVTQVVTSKCHTNNNTNKKRIEPTPNLTFPQSPQLPEYWQVRIDSGEFEEWEVLEVLGGKE